MKVGVGSTLALLVMGVVGCGAGERASGGGGSAAEAPASGLTWTVEFVRAREGGLCMTPDGGGAVCDWVVTVRDDGTYSARTQGSEPEEGEVAPGAASRLAAIVDDGWDALTREAFDGTCPIAYDGQERIYRVRRLPTGPGAERADADVRETRSCTHDWDHPEAQGVVRRLERVWEESGLPD